MKFYGIQKLSLVDYDSEVSCTLFTKGCNLRCPFCHNFELVEDSGYNNEAIDNKELEQFLLSHKNRLTGVVITGGEPTINQDLPETIRWIKSFGYKVKLDTNGSNPKMLKELIDNKLIDYVAIDINNSPDDYSGITGRINLDMEPFKESVSYLLSHDFPYEFRTTLIDEYHKEDNIRKLGKFIKGARVIFLQKFEVSEYVPLKTLHPVDNKKVLEYKHILEEYVSEVHLRGY